jgi:hypothetical protein
LRGKSGAGEQLIAMAATAPEGTCELRNVCRLQRLFSTNEFSDLICYGGLLA